MVSPEPPKGSWAGNPLSPAILREIETIELDLAFPADPFVR